MILKILCKSSPKLHNNPSLGWNKAAIDNAIAGCRLLTNARKVISDLPLNVVEFSKSDYATKEAIRDSILSVFEGLNVGAFHQMLADYHRLSLCDSLDDAELLNIFKRAIANANVYETVLWALSSLWGPND